jgi:hypothetical protein
MAKTHTLNNVWGRVDDTGSEFRGGKNPDLNQFDIAVGDFSKGGTIRAQANLSAATRLMPFRAAASAPTLRASPDVSLPAIAAQPPGVPVEARAEGGAS